MTLKPFAVHTNLEFIALGLRLIWHDIICNFIVSILKDSWLNHAKQKEARYMHRVYEVQHNVWFAKDIIRSMLKQSNR